MKIKLYCLISMITFIVSCDNVKEDQSNKESLKTDSTVPLNTTQTPAVVPFLNQLEYGKIKFIITSPQLADANTFTISSSGFTMSNDSLSMSCEGLITLAELGELDGDNAPELLVVSQSGSDKKGKAYLFSANGDKSLSMVNLPDFSLDLKIAKGYAGFDEFALVENSFSHRFPLYENGKPVNKTRQLQYKLKSGEAMKQLVLTKSLEY
jgi:hypothetical protein